MILIVAVLLFGGKRIPELARALGRASYEYKKTKNILKENKEAIENEGERPEEYNPKDV